MFSAFCASHLRKRLIKLFVIKVGIPFGLQHFKLAKIALSPIGKAIVPKAMAIAPKSV